MSASYYREQTNFYPPTIPHSAPNVVHAADNSTVARPDDHSHPGRPAQVSSPATSQVGPPRYCTVKGCTVILLPDYLHKMCEACRGRHRVYAMTKRAKRKAEKAALGMQGGQPVVWMPQDDENDDEGDAREGSPTSQHEEDLRPTDTAIANRYPPSTWDQNAIDPSLFSQESALAGALTLPGASAEHFRGQAPTGPHDLTRMQETPVASGSMPSVMNFQTGMQLPLASLSPAIFDRPSAAHDDSTPPRLCSIKGCKALVSSDSFYKMCEPCRDRYRNYGITKRAKWKQEKQIAVAELQKAREEEDLRRAEVGLPPLPKLDDPDWQEYEADRMAHEEMRQESVEGAAGPSMPRSSRMCTVSHCREILSPDYQYLRCDRHRLQNRHHSKLKRVRDKEVKAAAFNHWVVSVGGPKPEATPGLDNGPDSEEEHGRSYDQEGTPGTGFPPAARGMRRTNHVCIIKACFNLLSPTNPWRMCDMCRAKDRALRRDKALRVNDPITSEGDGANQEQEENSEKPRKPKKKKKKKAVEGAAQDATESMDAPAPQLPGADAQQAESQGPELIFMSPLLPSQPPSPLPSEQVMQPLDIPTGRPPPLDAPPANGAPPISSSHTVLAPSAPFKIVSAEEIASQTAQIESVTAPPKKKRKVKNATASATTTGPVQANAQASSSAPPAPMLPPPIHPPMPPGHEFPHHPLPPLPFPADGQPPPGPYPSYYMSPYGMQPYGNQPPYPYSHYGPHYQYPPSPYGYQSPYPPYPQPYPYPPYGQQPYAPPYPAGGPPPPPPAPPSVQGTYSVSADFVSRADYTAASQSVQQMHGAAPHYATFSAKTGEPHNRVSSVPSALRTKRPLEGEGMFYAGGHPPSSSSQSPPAAAPLPAPAAAVTATETATAPVGEAPSDGSGDRSSPTEAAAQTVCSNQKCHRPLPVSHNGSLCARCRERLKKRSEKAKHRFKLEPRKFVGKADVSAIRGESGAAGACQ